MTLPEIVTLVAQAMELKEGRHEYWHRLSLRTLRKDGAEMFTDHWQGLCRDWLLEHGYIELGKNRSAFHAADANIIVIECPASEFFARAIAQSSIKDEKQVA